MSTVERFANLDKRNPEITPNAYKPAAVGVLIGLLPIAIYLIYVWLT